MTNKEALNIINTWIEPMRKTLKGTLAHEFIDAVEVLERKEIRYAWHDLRENPDDLPQWPTKDVIVCFIMPYGEKVYRYCWYSKEKRCFVDERVFHRKDKAIAWREIEPFEE